MHRLLHLEEAAGPAAVSTGQLPELTAVADLVRAAWDRYAPIAEGRIADYIPALAAASPDWFGLRVAGVDGTLHAAGDADRAFSIQSISRPFVFALVFQALGGGRARESIGVNATGLPFNSVMAIELNGDRTMNPMVNAGAIATTSLVPGRNHAEKWRSLIEGLSRFAGRSLAMDEAVYASDAATNQRNQGIARLLQGYGRMYCDPDEATDLYTRQCAVNVTARDLAVMGATLADGGVNPVTRGRREGSTAMNVQASPLAPPPAATANESWLPMVAIALGQAIMSFNVAALPVSLSGMVVSFGVPPTTIATGIVMYSLAVAGFVMLGAKLVQRFGATAVFRYVVLAFGAAQVLMTFAPAAPVMFAAQLLAGLAAVNVPALVALIAHHYRGAQQATAVGALGSARAGAGVAAFLIGGILGTFIGWRPVFGLLVLVCALVFGLSFRLKPQAARPEVRIDLVGVALAAAAIILTVFGVNNLNRWGLGTARPGAPFDVLGMSPAPLMIVTGLVLLQFLVAWCRRVQARGGTPLLDLRVIAFNQEWAAVAMLPFNLTVFFTAMLVVRLYRRFTPRGIGMAGFALCTLALLWLAFVVRNDWSAPVVMTGLILFGLGQGALVTLVFNVLVTAAPKELAGDVGSLRGTAQNLAAGVGTAVAGALLVGLLSANVLRAVAENPRLPPEIQAQVDLDSVNFVSNDRLREVMARTTASPEQVAAAVEVNAAARLRALKIGLLIMACVSLLTILPASRLPGYRPDESPDGDAPGVAPGWLVPAGERA